MVPEQALLVVFSVVCSELVKASFLILRKIFCALGAVVHSDP